MNFSKALALVLGVGLIGALTKYFIFFKAYNRHNKDK